MGLRAWSETPKHVINRKPQTALNVQPFSVKPIEVRHLIRNFARSKLRPKDVAFGVKDTSGLGAWGLCSRVQVLDGLGGFRG